MDNNDRRQRQTPSGYASQQGTLLQPQSAQYPVVSASDRFRQQAPLTAQPPTSVPSGTRASSQSYGYAYDQGSQFVGSSIQPPYGAQDYTAAADQQPQRTSQYSQYGQNVMYNVPAAQASTANQSQYEPVQQYQQSRDPAIEALSSGFGVAQTQYYGVPGQEGPTSGSASALASQSVPSQYSSLGYTAQSAPVGRESLAPAYSTAGMTDPHQATSQGAYPQPGYGEQSGGSGNEYDDFYNNYQNELKKTNEETREGRLSESAARLFRMSDWLLHWAETLGESANGRIANEAAELTIGLVRDDENHYQQRLALWEEFNNCWLTTLQKELIMLQEYITSRQRPPAPQSWIEPDYLEKMGNQLVKNCDLMEKHGLVDYQMGVWEEEITASEYTHTNCYIGTLDRSSI
jgi:hypothetical protein